MGNTNISQERHSRSQVPDSLSMSEGSGGMEGVGRRHELAEVAVFVLEVCGADEFRFAVINPTYELWSGKKAVDLMGKTPGQVWSGHVAQALTHHCGECVRLGQTIAYEQYDKEPGASTGWSTTLIPLLDGQGKINRLIGLSTTLAERLQCEQPLTRQAARERLVHAIAQRIRESLDLSTILDRAVTEVRQFLDTDRVLIYRFEPDWQGIIVVEAVLEPWQTMVGTDITSGWQTQQIKDFAGGEVQVIADIAQANLLPNQVKDLAAFQVRANLVVPIIAEQHLWGLLMVHHCRGTRQWHHEEVELLQQLGTQLGLAVEQAELHQQIQCLNTYLGAKVRERTEKLQRALEHEELIRRLTEKVRDSLDESQILQTVVQKLVQNLDVDCCTLELYNPEQTTVTVAYEKAMTRPSSQGQTRLVADFPELYRPLLQRQPLQFVERIAQFTSKALPVTRLACPIFDNQGILGNLWLLRPRDAIFDESEIRLIEQVANQCAIAIRQARLYEAAQAQVQELERLSSLKDDFLKTISHELRTPMSSIQLGAQTLAKLIEQKQLAQHSPTFARVLDLFHKACQRQNRLISDLLTLCYMDANTEELNPVWIQLPTWIPEIVQPFVEQIDQQHQQLCCQWEADLPAVKVDSSVLGRVLSELLNNACKYTPAEEQITITTQKVPAGIRIEVSNTGVEIAADELSRIFDKFYRIPSNDPWQYGGTGIGLALVQKLVEVIGATINVTSGPGQTTFGITLPCIHASTLEQANGLDARQASSSRLP